MGTRSAARPTRRGSASSGDLRRARRENSFRHEDTKARSWSDRGARRMRLDHDLAFVSSWPAFMTLRVAVIGVGHLGRHHARILSTLPGASLAAVVDTNRARADEIASAHRTRAAYDARDLVGEVDAVTVAVPTEIHRDIRL